MCVSEQLSDCVRKIGGENSEACLQEERLIGESRARKGRFSMHFILWQHKQADRISSDLLAEYLAGTFVLVLNWWIESTSQIAPHAVNELFRSLVLPSLARN
jgi:hypothetical protein